MTSATQARRRPKWSRQLLQALALLLLPAGAHADPKALSATPVGASSPVAAVDSDTSWTEGTNRQPASRLAMGPVTWSMYVDSYYAFQFRQPADHTIFPTTTAPRHDELSLNLAAIGLQISGLDGPIGRFIFQYGSNVETVAGQDATTARGYYLNEDVFKYVQQAVVGWHFHALAGVDVIAGIFPSYVGLESYLPEENWNYTHGFLADATPYYFSGVAVTMGLTATLSLELALVNGWQSFGLWDESHGGGYQVSWRPRPSVALSHCAYAGQDVMGDPDAVRVYTDTGAQLRYFTGTRVRSAAFALAGDLGYEHRGNAPSGAVGGFMIAHRIVWDRRWATAVRGDLFYDATHAFIASFPLGSPYSLPTSKPFVGGGITVTQDFWPSPWLVVRLEYAHRNANQPYFSGAAGITGPGGIPPALPSQFAPALRSYDDRVIANVTVRM